MTKHVQFLELLIGPLANQGGGGSSATLIEKSISANGTYNASDDSADGYSKAVVNVQPDLQSKSVTITENGTTNVAPDQGKDGLSGVAITVNVSGGGGDRLDFANEYIGGGFTGALKDSTNPSATPVTKVWQYALYSNKNLTEIDLRQCTEIKANAFQYCSALESVNLPLCENIGSSAFTYCNLIDTLSLPVCKKVEAYVFGNLPNITELQLPSMEDIGSGAFTGAHSSSGSGYNQAVKLIELPALKSCSGVEYFPVLTAVRLGSSVNALSSNGFRYNASLDTVIFGRQQSAVPSMGSNVFGASKIKTTGVGYVYVPDSLLTTWKAASNWSNIDTQIKGLSAIIDWTAGTYNKPDVVKHGGHYYRCNNDGTTGEPGVDTTNWQDLGVIY